jgi:hypothetical protein
MSDDHTTLRARLVAIDDELRWLPADAFADKHALNREADSLRSVLRTELSADLDAASDEWAERAGRKGTHSVNESEKAAAAAIVSPGEGGNH